MNVAAILCVILGVVVMAYPVVATLIMNQSQLVAAQKVQELNKSVYSPEQRKEFIERAKSYNDQLVSGPILDPFLEKVAPNTKLYQDYLTYLNFDGIMASVVIPKIEVNLPIYHGTDDETLSKGAGHLFGSSLPVGGINTHSVITAHSGLGTATMFDNLPKLQKGDDIFINVAGETLKYQVTSTEVVIPTDTKSLNVQNGRDMVTLITCTPYGINTHRLLVHADRQPISQQETKELQEVQYSVWQNWMIIPIILSIWFIWLVLFPPRKRSGKEGAKHRR
ncbi:hypothetical protein BSR29_07395 [Boudabousia liubingyangii]|uniref:Class C sortase n=1 Tax=Boudabousia liubingyangii TaxID=1921764 RepID=A0A1Q5PKH2_9ACTO|nr:hypothetical protein BSR29_07395 [Boudabousia liubingyangii]OKL47123.1 hypothetical protein BSR28_04875 [Boudabousia liubingyangii]